MYSVSVDCVYLIVGSVKALTAGALCCCMALCIHRGRQGKWQALTLDIFSVFYVPWCLNLGAMCIHAEGGQGAVGLLLWVSWIGDAVCGSVFDLIILSP